MRAGWVNLTVPRGAEREMCSHGEEGYIPFRTPAGVWLVQVRDYTASHFTKAGFAIAAVELQQYDPPDPGSIRSVQHLYT